MLKEAGATEVHVCISSPPMKNPCFYGIDVSTQGELMAAQHSVEEMRELIGADSLTFLSVEGMLEAIGRTDTVKIVDNVWLALQVNIRQKFIQIQLMPHEKELMIIKT